MAVVFTDSFTVGADVNIDAYPATPDYVYNNGSGTAITVNAANDRAQWATAGAFNTARIIDAAGAITGSQEITASCRQRGSYESAGVAVRMDASGADEMYYSYVDSEVTNEVQLYRVDAGVSNLIASWNDSLTPIADYTHRLKAVTNGSQIDLEIQVGSPGTTHTFSDTDANRKTTGVPGIIGYTEGANGIWVDNVSVDDLGGAAAAVIHISTLTMMGVQ